MILCNFPNVLGCDGAGSFVRQRMVANSNLDCALSDPGRCEPGEFAGPAIYSLLSFFRWDSLEGYFAWRGLLKVTPQNVE